MEPLLRQYLLYIFICYLLYLCVSEHTHTHTHVTDMCVPVGRWPVSPSECPPLLPPAVFLLIHNLSSVHQISAYTSWMSLSLSLCLVTVSAVVMTSFTLQLGVQYKHWNVRTINWRLKSTLYCVSLLVHKSHVTFWLPVSSVLSGSFWGFV